MSDPLSYASVFSDKLPISVWSKIVAVMKTVDKGIAVKIPKKKAGPRIVATWRGATALCAVAEIMETFDYSIERFLNLDISLISETRVGAIFEYFMTTETLPSVGPIRRHSFTRARSEILCEQFGNKYEIRAVEVIGRWSMPSSQVTRSQKINMLFTEQIPNHIIQKKPIDVAKMQLVAAALPQQPWKPGMQQMVAFKIGLPLTEVRRYIKELIKTDEFNNQIDGVVFNKEGIIVGLDTDRANSIYKLGSRYVRSSK